MPWSKYQVFVTSVLKYWGSLVTGGVFIGLLSIWQGTGHAVRPWVYWLVAFAAFFVASFKAWEAESNAKDAALVQISAFQNTEKRDASIQKQIEALAQLVDQGQFFSNRCRTERDVVPRGEVENWAVEVENVVKNAFDSTYISIFRSGVGVPMGAAHWPNCENRFLDGFVIIRLYRIQGFITELRAKLSHS